MAQSTAQSMAQPLGSNNGFRWLKFPWAFLRRHKFTDFDRKLKLAITVNTYNNYDFVKIIRPRNVFAF